MSAPDMAEVDRLVSEHEYKLECYHSGIVWAGETKATRTALLDYVRGVIAERDALIHDLEEEDLLAAYYAGEESGYRRGRKEATQPVSATEVLMPPKCHPLHKLGQRLAELLDENQWAECERLLLECWKHEQKPSAAEVPIEYRDAKAGTEWGGEAYSAGYFDGEAAGYARGKLEAVPSGYWLAPVEPTPEMKSAGLNVEVGENNHVLTWTEVAAIYREMRDAALRGEVKP